MAWPRTLSVVFTCLLSACAAPIAAPERADADAGVRLRRLLDASDDALLDRNPLYGL